MPASRYMVAFHHTVSFCEVGHYVLQARENDEVHGLVCLTMKSILLLNSSRNKSSVDDLPSQAVT